MYMKIIEWLIVSQAKLKFFIEFYIFFLYIRFRTKVKLLASVSFFSHHSLISGFNHLTEFIVIKIVFLMHFVPSYHKEKPRMDNILISR